MWKHISTKSVLRNLVPRYDNLFVVTKWVGTVAYQVALPERLKLHQVFHISFLKRYHEDPDLERRWEAQAPPDVQMHFD